VSRPKRLPREHQTALVNHHHAHALAALFYADWTIYSAEGIGDHVSDSMRSFIEHSNAVQMAHGPTGAAQNSLAGAKAAPLKAAGVRKRRPVGKLESAVGVGRTATLTDRFACHFRLSERSAVRRLQQQGP
jgi:predicted NodU family carbamoyl transferase